jgi:hypothetical protein
MEFIGEIVLELVAQFVMAVFVVGIARLLRKKNGRVPLARGVAALAILSATGIFCGVLAAAMAFVFAPTPVIKAWPLRVAVAIAVSALFAMSTWAAWPKEEGEPRAWPPALLGLCGSIAFFMLRTWPALAPW